MRRKDIEQLNKKSKKKTECYHCKKFFEEKELVVRELFHVLEENALKGYILECKNCNKKYHGNEK